MNENICNMVTENILAQLDNGVIPWKTPWALMDRAVSHATGKAYSFLNKMLVGAAGEYATYQQITNEGGHVKKGAKSKPVVFWKLFVDGVDADELGEVDTTGKKVVPYLRYYRVFNLDDTEGVKAKHKQEAPNVAAPDEEAERIARAYLDREKINLLDGEIRDEAFYAVQADEIQIPQISQFKSTADYYSTLFHEIAHSTGSAKRLNRWAKEERTAEKRALEELVAEMTAAYLCARAGVSTDESLTNSAAYIQGWRNRIAQDNKLVILAAGRAQKAVDFILGENQAE